MNGRSLAALGVPKPCVNIAIQAVQSAAKYNRSVTKPLRIDLKDMIRKTVSDPDCLVGDTHFGGLASALIEERDFVRPAPCEYRSWGDEYIDDGSHEQMKQACSLPMAVKGALMPDAHIGYGLPIGGVLALDNAVAPYAVGVDIACRMKMTVYDIPAKRIEDSIFDDSLTRGTVFGVGRGQEKPQDHPVMDQDWEIARITRMKKDLARTQLGTSGSGNHFVEWGVLYLDNSELEVEPGIYLALLSHSGSRGPGAAACNVYTSIARERLPQRYSDLGRLAWLDMDSEAGQEYWAVMNLMGDYAAANHDVIHRRISKIIGEKPIATVENHHNFAWLEEHDGKQVYVHRKGATPAGKGVYGIIPGSMGDPAYVVRGKGLPESICSASHGAGRKMSRKKAKATFNFKSVRGTLAKRGIRVLSAGADEVPGVYKNINEVMAQQTGLVDSIARFEPRVVMMCGDGSKAED